MKFLLTAALFFSFVLASGQPSKGGASAKRVDSVSTYRAVGTMLPNNNARNDSLIRSIHSEMQVLKRENELYKNALDVNSNLFGGISTYFSIIAILLSIIVVAIPVVNYFLVLKPSERMVAKVEGLESEVLIKIESNFENYFENLRRAKTKKMLALLDDRMKVSEVTGYFLLNSPDKLEEADAVKIIDFLKENDDVEKSDLAILNSMVIYSELPIAEKYYKSVFEEDNTRNYEYAIEYLVKNNFPEHIKYVEKIIAATNKGHVLLLDFFDYISKSYLGNWRDKKAPEKKEIGIRYAKLLFDSDTILKAIEGQEIPTRHYEPRMANINVINGNPFLRDTKYYYIYLKETDEKYAKRTNAEK